MVLAELPAIIITLLMCVALVGCGDWIPDRTCATLYSEAGYLGSYFSLKDFDQAVLLKKEYRHSVDGWQKTGSVRVEADCKAFVCSESYLQGTCAELSSSKADLKSLFRNVRSANCTCARICTCDEVLVPDDAKSFGYIGRAYLKGGGCNTCNAEYVKIQKKKDFSDFFKSSIEAFTLTKGCSLKIFPDSNNVTEPIVIEGPVYQNFTETIESLQVYCEDNVASDSVTKLSSAKENYPPLIKLPVDTEDFFKKIQSNAAMAAHPGARIALQSAKVQRSKRHAYVILVGERLPYFLGFPQCQGKSDDKIWECRMKAKMDHIGLHGELRLITIPMLLTEESYRTTIGQLDNFLFTHDELDKAIPNAVIVYHKITDNSISLENSTFQRKLQMVHTLRDRLLDERYSNLALLLDDMGGLVEAEQTQPENSIAWVEAEIARWSFPRPVVIALRSHLHKFSCFVNGYLRMENNEYFPRNLEISLVNICEKGGDALGREILKTVFNDSKTTHWSIEPIVYNIAIQKEWNMQRKNMKQNLNAYKSFSEPSEPQTSVGTTVTSTTTTTKPTTRKTTTVATTTTTTPTKKPTMKKVSTGFTIITAPTKKPKYTTTPIFKQLRMLKRLKQAEDDEDNQLTEKIVHDIIEKLLCRLAKFFRLYKQNWNLRPEYVALELANPMITPFGISEICNKYKL